MSSDDTQPATESTRHDGPAPETAPYTGLAPARPPLTWAQRTPLVQLTLVRFVATLYALRRERSEPLRFSIRYPVFRDRVTLFGARVGHRRGSCLYSPTLGASTSIAHFSAPPCDAPQAADITAEFCNGISRKAE